MPTIYCANTYTPTMTASRTYLTVPNWTMRRYITSDSTSYWISTTAATTSSGPWDTLWTDWIDDGCWANDRTTDGIVNWTTTTTIASPHVSWRSFAEIEAIEQQAWLRVQAAQQRHDIRLTHAPEAVARSRELLLEHLTPAQRETFTKHKWFVVEGGASKARYRVRDTGHMVANIDVLTDLVGSIERDNLAALQGRVKHRLCGHADLSVIPLYDQLLAQKMMLECDEERFLKLANRHGALAA